VPWPAIVVVLCAINLVLAVVALWRSGTATQTPPPAPETETVIVQQDTQSLQIVDARMEALERSLRELRTTVRQSSKNLAAVNAQKEIKERRERIQTKDLEEQGVEPEEIRRAVRSAQMPEAPRAELTDEQRTAFDALIDSDSSGGSVQQFLRALNNKGELQAYVEILRAKGDQWFDAAVAEPQGSESFGPYIDNALYFYNIIAAVSSDSSTVAYIESKRTQIQLALQNRRLIDENAARTEQTREAMAEMEERLRPKETAAQAQQRLVNERRRKYIKDYPSSGAVKPYPTDWDPDPRVREERGIE
jgi:hypothetical protein